MISSFEEAMLLLKKWQSESANLYVIVSSEGIVFRSTGVVQEIDADGTLLLRNDASEDFVMSRLANCTFGFDTSTLPLPKELSDVLPKNWDSLLVAALPNGGKLLIFSLK